ncbi:MAG TPA: arginine--tRNA ligase [Candidatus Choladousia intestinipullorum]|nr:arginine--tRNA ligase [Candidatus Choladousia intestinipullorum]
MKKILDMISQEVMDAFAACGYDAAYGKTGISNRPDLCEYQCNGAMAAKKVYGKAPILIAQEVVEKLQGNPVFEEAAAVNPGFINIKVSGSFLSDYLMKMQADETLSVDKAEEPKKIVIDYGGPNVAKPLHVGHLRSAIIGESIKRIERFAGHEVIGDVHLGDWGLQMGLIITEVKKRQPDLVYFDENYQGEYPQEAPFTISELEEIYPTASAKSKEDEAYREEALEATARLQDGVPGYRALWQHILNVSVADLKRNYSNLNVEFDLWKKESDAQPYIPQMTEYMKKEGYAYLDDGALIVDVKEETDTKEVPPCIILKSDGAALYTTTDLATIIERMELFHPDEIIYVVDKRQEMHFTQVFRCARKTKLVGDETGLKFLGFGTMNGKDGKPFKTREGGVMRLETLISDITAEMYKKIMENHETDPKEAEATARLVGLSAIKYGDLSNQASKDYIFDTDKFTSFEGNTGPYILYTIVRIKSILNKYRENGGSTDRGKILPPASASEKGLMMEIVKFNSVIAQAAEELAPHKICSFIYDLANAFNRFYHETRILAEEDRERRESWITLLGLTREVLETSIDLLGFSAPERM